MPGTSLKQLLLGAVFAAAFASCESPPPNVYVSGSQTAAAVAVVAAGEDEVGEPCHFQSSLAGNFGTGARRTVDLYCGYWGQPSGRIFDLGDAAGVQLNNLAMSGPWRAYLDQRFACGAPTATRILDGAPAILLQCTRRTGGWPHLAMTTAVGGRVFAADAFGSALPALEVTLGALGGRPVATGAAPPSEAARLIARGSARRRFGSGDLQRFYDLTAAGDADNTIDDPAAAEQAFREALAIQQRILGTSDPGLALTMMKLAAQISHQRTAPEADRLLDQASTLAARSNDPLVAAQLDYYRAVTTAYEGKPREADKWAAMAEAAFVRLLPPGIGESPRTYISVQYLKSRGIDVRLLTTDP
jgi:hypothetical protein